MTESTFGIRHGVLYEASPRDLAPWAARINYNSPHEQNYGQFVMVTVPDDDPGSFAGQSWMIDTYHFTSPGLRTRPGQSRADAVIQQAAERDFVSSQAVWEFKGNCYYNACVRLNAENARLFREVCDLSEWVHVSDEEAADYNRDDIIDGVHLYREHGYVVGCGDIGICLRRKGAEKSPVRQAMALRSRLRQEIPSYNGWGYLMRAEELERFAYEHRDNETVLGILFREADEIAFARKVRDEWSGLHPYPGSDQMHLFDYDDEGDVIGWEEGGDEE